MSTWQYMAALEGYIKANSTDEPGALTSKEADELWEWIEGGD
ncbi:hypothetical protein [Ochrobactrum quorumnocens]|nr:hypothetical protein [[Ochrobactrum] quorumnocens]